MGRRQDFAAEHLGAQGVCVQGVGGVGSRRWQQPRRPLFVSPPVSWRVVPPSSLLSRLGIVCGCVDVQMCACMCLCARFALVRTLPTLHPSGPTPQVYDGLGAASPLLLRTSGTTSGAPQATSTGAALTVQLRVDQAVSGRGFASTLHVIPAVTLADLCTPAAPLAVHTRVLHTLVDPASAVGVVASRSSTYPHLLACEVQVLAPEGVQLLLTLLSLDTEACCDSVTVRCPCLPPPPSLPGWATPATVLAGSMALSARHLPCRACRTCGRASVRVSGVWACIPGAGH